MKINEGCCVIMFYFNIIYYYVTLVNVNTMFSEG